VADKAVDALLHAQHPQQSFTRILVQSVQVKSPRLVTQQR
jgi:hypothetical protein